MLSGNQITLKISQSEAEHQFENPLIVLVHWSLMLCLITFTNLKCNQDRHVVVFYPNWTNLPLNRPALIEPWTVRRSTNCRKTTEKWTSLHQPQHHRRHQTSIWVWWRHLHVKTLAPPCGHINSISLIQLFKKLDLSARPMSPMMTNQVQFDLCCTPMCDVYKVLHSHV